MPRNLKQKTCLKCGQAFQTRNREAKFCSLSCSTKYVWKHSKDRIAKPIKPIRIEGDIAYIPLTKGYVAIIDAVDVPLVKDCNWSVRADARTRDKIYAVRVDPRVSGKKRKLTTLHRLLLGLESSDINGDHRDGDTMNNRRSNLRPATQMQNSWNRKKSKNNTTGYIGVCKVHWGRYQARIRIDKRNVNLGFFDDPIEAARVYDKAAYDTRGEFATLNFPEEHHAECA